MAKHCKWPFAPCMTLGPLVGNGRRSSVRKTVGGIAIVDVQVSCTLPFREYTWFLRPGGPRPHLGRLWGPYLPLGMGPLGAQGPPGHWGPPVGPKGITKGYYTTFW